MKFAQSLVYLSTIAAATKTIGSIKVAVDGVDKEIYVVGSEWAANYTTIADDGFSLHGGGRIYFAEEAMDDWKSDGFWQIPLINHSFSYDVDVSQVECGCNAAGYFINMPAYNQSGQPDNGDGKNADYYCDANDASHYCPEMDTFEGNKYTFATTLHTCNDPNNKHYTQCDGGGC